MKNLLIITQKVNVEDQLLGFFIPWLQRFADRFAQIHVLCLEKGRADLPDNVHVHSMGKDMGASKLKQLIRFYKLTYSLRHSYDAVFVHMNPIWVVLGGAWWHLLGKRIYFWYTHKAVTIKLRMAEYFADVIFTASKESFRLPSKKVVITGHGIDTELFSPTTYESDSTLSILTVGRIAPVKNYEVLVDAISVLKNQAITVTIVGEPALGADRAYKKDLQKKIHELGLSKQFIFKGKIQHKDLVQIYQSHDLFVHMSRTGSLDKALLEAMACGMRVVSSNDVARAFLPSEAIFSEDDPQDLAEKIRSSISSPITGDLREYVVMHHNLNTLINTISKSMQV